MATSRAARRISNVPVDGIDVAVDELVNARIELD
jgi:hypothetical protein